MNEAKITRELKEIIYYIRKYGIDRMNRDIHSILEDESLKTEFFTQVHKGFYFAQERALTLLTKILKERKRLKKELVVARTAKNKQQQSQLTAAIEKSKYYECVVRKTMDALVWIIFNHQTSSVRRLYCREEPIDITDSNLESESEYIAEYKNSHPDGFALICDLTSVAQIGDIITISLTDGIGIVELKEGHVNKQVIELITEASKNPCPAYISCALQGKNPDFVKHLERTVKQIQKDNNVVSTINTGHGSDPKTGLGVHITEGDLIENDYSIAMHDLSLNCSKSGYSISTIQNCLYVGVYDTAKFPDDMFNVWMQCLNTKTYTYDLRRSFIEPLAYPCFLHPFSETFMIDIVTGKKLVKIALGFDEWFKLLESYGCNPKWMGKKQTARVKAKNSIPGAWLEVDGRGIEIEKDGATMQLSTGICSRIFSKFLTPLSACELIVELLQNTPPNN